MTRVTGKFRVDLPFGLSMRLGEIDESITIPLDDPSWEIVIYPPTYLDDRGVTVEPKVAGENPSLGIRVGSADTLLVDVSRDISDFTEVDLATQNQFIDAAYEAIRKLIKLCRWRTQQHWLYPEELTKSHRVDFVDGSGVELDKAVLFTLDSVGMESALTKEAWKQIESDLGSKTEPPLYLESLLLARFHLLNKEYRSSFINAAVAVEILVTRYIRASLKNNDAASDSAIDTFVNDMSNRTLSTVMLGLLTEIDKLFLIEVRDIFIARNAIVHGKKTSVSRDVANSAIQVATKLIDEYSFPDGPPAASDGE